MTFERKQRIALCILTNVPAKTNAELELGVIRYSSQYPIDAGHKKAQPVALAIVRPGGS